MYIAYNSMYVKAELYIAYISKYVKAEDNWK